VNAGASVAIAGDPERLLVRAIGLRQLTAIVFGYTVGTGIFVLPAIVVAELGTAGVLAYLLCTAIIALVVLVFAEAGSRVTVTGGPYAYVETALGGFAGVLTAVLLVLSDATAAGAIATVLAGSVGRAVGITGGLAVAALTVVLVTSIAALNVFGVRSGARLVEVATAAKLVPLLFFVAAGAFFVTPAHLRWTSTPGLGDVARTSGTLFFAFTGIESALVPTGEVRDPARTVPRAAMIAIGLAALLYMSVQTVAVGVLGPALAADRVAPLAAAADRFAGHAGRLLILAGVVVSTFGWLTGSILATPRSLFALSRDGYLPRWLASVHPRCHSPHVAIVAYSATVLALAITGSFQGLAVLSSLASLAVYALSAVAVLVLRHRNVRSDREPFRLPGGGMAPVLACGTIAAVMAATISRHEYELFGVTVAVAAFMYAYRSYRSRTA
jgi:amino acid transporter